MFNSKFLLPALALSTAIALQAAAPSIGFVNAKGSFQLDNSRIWSNATIFDGSVIETKVAPSQVHLSDGSELVVGAGSRVRVFESRAVLEKGAVQLQSSTQYRVEARALNIVPSAAGATAGIELRGTGRIAASASTGELLVTNKEKVLVARVIPGHPVTLDTTAAAKPGLTRIAGCLTASSHTFMLLDQPSQVTFELHGASIDKEIGNRVEITGTAESSHPKLSAASQVVKVIHVNRLEQGACLTPGAIARRVGPIAAVGGTLATISAAAGTAGTVAIIGGVTVAGTVGGLEAAGAFSNALSEEVPQTSR